LILLFGLTCCPQTFSSRLLFSFQRPALIPASLLVADVQSRNRVPRPGIRRFATGAVYNQSNPELSSDIFSFSNFFPSAVSGTALSRDSDYTDFTAPCQRVF
jgi:hypothetical protein